MIISRTIPIFFQEKTFIFAFHPAHWHGQATIIDAYRIQNRIRKDVILIRGFRTIFAGVAVDESNIWKYFVRSNGILVCEKEILRKSKNSVTW